MPRSTGSGREIPGPAVAINGLENLCLDSRLIGKPGDHRVTIYEIDPLEDPRWERLSLQHPSASAFHTPAWLKALQRTYGYEPVALTTSSPGTELTSGIVFCRIKSRLTGNRLVSLPFSDHCEPLFDSPRELDYVLSRLKGDLRHKQANYIEIRPVTSRFGSQAGFAKAEEFWLHRIDLRRPADAMFRGFHANVQRNVRRAEGRLLRCEEGTSETLLEDFYRLLVLTRRRHHVPPQPRSWFRTLLDCMGEQANISVAYQDGVAVASIFTLRHNDVLIYKYGCFDYRHRQSGGMTWLLWLTIQKAQQHGLLEFDLGRSDFEDLGLITFKDRWASRRSTLTYWRRGTSRFDSAAAQWAVQFGGRMLAHMPNSLLTTAGGLLYRHVG